MAYTTIDDPTKFFSTNLWVADNASSRSLTGFGHQPDLVWTKHRGSGATNPAFTDSVRGGDKQLNTPTNAVEDAGSHGKISSFDSDGITVIDGTNATYPRLYFNSLNPFGASVGGNYVGWSWKAGGTASSNGDGSITSTVSVNSTSGFSIVSYVGGGASSATVGHGLGATPAMIIIKNRENDPEWRVWHQKLSGSTYKLGLNSTGAQDSSATVFNGQSSTTFTIGSDPSASGSGNNIMAYCFKEVKGFSKFGSYTGNGNSDGAFAYTGFRPAFVMIKSSSASSTNWNIYDNKRDGFNGSNENLSANLADAESSGNNRIDILSNGFKVRASTADVGTSSATYIYMAFAEHPFVTEGTKAAGTAR